MNRRPIIGLYILATVFVLSNCSNENKPEYISQIPDIESFTYSAIPASSLEEKRVDLSPELLISGSGQSEYFIGTPFWVEKIADKIWVSDPTKGEIAEFDEEGNFSRVIATKGHGPGELQQPATIHFSGDNSSLSDTVLVLDSGLKSILRFTLEGEEVFRISNDHLLSVFFNNRILAYKNDSYLAPIMNHEKYVLGIINQSGELTDSFINRIVPMGYQPVTHNRIYFDYEASANTFTYAYHGLPLVFIESFDQTSKSVYDFWPEKELSDFNIELTPQPSHVRAPVSSIAQDLFVNKNKIYFRLENEIIVFNHKNGSVEHVISLVDDEGFPAIFQQMVYSDETFFLINRFTSDIYYFTEDDISTL